MELKEIIESKEELFLATFGYNNYIFRLLTLGEFRRFNKLLNNNVTHPMFIYEEVFNLCSEYKYEYLSNKTPAGDAISLGNLIYELSGNKEGKEFLLEIAEVRKELPVDSIYEHMKIIILTAFSSYTPKCILDMTEKEFIYNFVCAENKLAKSNQNFQRLDLKAIYDELYNPKEKVKETKEEVVVHNVEKMEQEIGYWEVQEAEQRFLQEERARLKENYLKELDKRKG